MSMLYLSTSSEPIVTNIAGVIKTTESRIKKTHKMAVFVSLMTESLVKSSQMMSDYG